MGSCNHRPPCRADAAVWVCCQRTRIEDAVRRGLITRESALSLLTKYRVPITDMKAVYRGEVVKVDVLTQERLV
jgi:hypothetical protein